MMRLRMAGLGTGLALGFAGIIWHWDWLVWAGVGVLGGVVALRFMKREDVIHHEYRRD